jgi:hypothetical protein
MQNDECKVTEGRGEGRRKDQKTKRLKAESMCLLGELALLVVEWQFSNHG